MPLFKISLIQLGAALVCLSWLPVAAQGPFAGSWVVAKAENAPWLAARPELKPHADPALRKARFTFRPGRVIAPSWMGCKKARYEMLSLGFDALFEGGLSDPEKGLHDAKGLARQLGFRAEPVPSMLTGCGELLFHLQDQDTAQFALDNMIYTLKRSGTRRAAASNDIFSPVLLVTLYSTGIFQSVDNRRFSAEVLIPAFRLARWLDPSCTASIDMCWVRLPANVALVVIRTDNPASTGSHSFQSSPSGLFLNHPRPKPAPPRRVRYRWPLLMVWAVFLVSLVPALLTFSAADPAWRTERDAFLHTLPLVGENIAALEKSYNEEIEPVQELRQLTLFPVSWKGRWFDIDKNYTVLEKWFTDRLALRDLMIRGKNEIDFRLFNSSTRVYFGKGDYIYGRSLIDKEIPATENLLASAENLAAAQRGVALFSRNMAAEGVTTLFITPMQRDYFGEGGLPFFAPRLPKPSRFMALYTLLKNDKAIHFVDVDGLLRAEQGKYPLYFRQDFHWTDMSAMAAARETTNRIAALEQSAVRWHHALAFEQKPMYGSDARFAARLFMADEVLEPDLIKTWKDVHVRTPLNAQQTGLEMETDIVNDAALLPPLCMYGNSFGDGMVRSGLPEHFQRFTLLSREQPLEKAPELTRGRCKYLLVQLLDISVGHWRWFVKEGASAQ